jgi:uncharacterized oligopeptide transporter (OPT) family protein
VGPGIALLTVILLWKAYAFGPDQARILHERAAAAGMDALEGHIQAGGSLQKLPAGMPQLGAPQAGALKSAIEIVQKGDVPVGKYIAGAILGLAVSLLVSPGLGVMVGLSLYLPFEYMSIFGIGGLLSILIARWRGAHFAEEWGVPVAAGLIVGDSLIGVIVALVKVFSSGLGGG